MLNQLKIFKIFALSSLPAFFATPSPAQGAFVNLNFEQAVLSGYPPDPPGFVPFNAAIPGWVGYAGTNQLSQALYNSISFGGALVSVVDRQSANCSSFVIAGNYTASLDAGVVFPDGIHPETVSAAIAQTATVPITARSLRFAAWAYYGNPEALQVTLNGQDIPYFALSNGPNFAIYGADVTSFQGTVAELRFTERPMPTQSSISFLDSIQFSNLAIPEPGAIPFAVLGLALFFHRCSRRPRRSCQE